MSRTILLADDSVTIQKVVELTFMEEEVEVIAVGSGSEAVEKLEDLTPSLLIADVHMPGPDGFELCRQVKRDKPGVPVLLLVGTFEAFDPQDVEASGADGYLKKPFDSQELMRRVEDLLAVAPPEAAPVVEVPAPAESPEEPLAVTAPSTREPADRDLLVGVDAEIDALSGVSESSYAGKATEAPERHPAEPRQAAAVRSEVVPLRLSDDDVERIARRVVELLSDGAVREVAWEVIPDLAEVVIKDRLRELERQAD